MYLTSEKKAELFAQYGNDAKNTGAAESQIALFTFRINHLTEHLKQNRKDFNTERALTNLVRTLSVTAQSSSNSVSVSKQHAYSTKMTFALRVSFFRSAKLAVFARMA